MPSVTIDTCIFALPSEHATQEEVMGYVETLIDWSTLLDESWIEIYLCESISQDMLDENIYPIREKLKVLFKTIEVDVADANTVATVIDRLLRKTPTFETYFKISDILLNEVTITPDVLSIHTSKKLSSNLARIVVMIAIIRSCLKTPILDHNLIIKPWGRGSKIQVSAQIIEIDISREDLTEIPKYPHYFQGEVLAYENFKELVQSLDENAIWKGSDCEANLELATRIALYKSRIRNGDDPNWKDTHGFCFGTNFYTRMQEMERSGSPGLLDRTIRAIVETLEKMNLQDVHALRINEGGASPQQMRGKDKAWRRDIDREYHLHYWELTNGEIEFASIGPHNDFNIP